jgi:hypothetical protein
MLSNSRKYVCEIECIENKENCVIYYTFNSTNVLFAVAEDV